MSPSNESIEVLSRVRTNQFPPDKYPYIILTALNYRFHPNVTISALWFVHDSENRIELVRAIGPSSRHEYQNLPEFGEDSLYSRLLTPKAIKKSDSYCRKLQRRAGKWQIPLRKNGNPVDSILVKLFQENIGSDSITHRIFNPVDYTSEWDLSLNRILGAGPGEEEDTSNRRDAFYVLPGSDRKPFAFIGATDIYKAERLSDKILEQPVNDLLVYATLLQYAKLIEKHQNQKSRAEDLESKLIEQGQLKGWVLATQQVAHEVRNPHAAIGGFTRRIKEKVERYAIGTGEHAEDFASILKYASRVAKESKKVEDLAADLENLTGKVKIRRERVDINKIVEQVVSSIQAPDSVKLSVEYQNDLPKVSADPYLTEEAIRKILIDNIEAYNGISGRVEVSTHKGDGFAEIGIRNIGRSIADEKTKSVLNPALDDTESRPYIPRGTLKLGVANRYITEQGGSLELVNGKVEDGTPKVDFVAKLPYASENSAKQTTQSSPQD